MEGEASGIADSSVSRIGFLSILVGLCMNIKEKQLVVFTLLICQIRLTPARPGLNLHMPPPYSIVIQVN